MKLIEVKSLIWAQKGKLYKIDERRWLFCRRRQNKQQNR